MRGKWNPTAKRYENRKGTEAEQYYGFDDDEIKELKQIKKITDDGGTYLERYATELNVNAGDLLKDILQNNSMERFNSVRSYYDFKMLKQTLVKETGPMATMKEIHNAVAGVYGNPFRN